MPTYNYVCKECEHPLEVRQRMSDSPLKECPKCGAKDGLKKIIVPNTGGIQFKGKGWFNSGGY